MAQITASLATNVPGDTIILTNKVWSNADILFKKNGAPGNPITLRAETPGQVILSGNAGATISNMLTTSTWIDDGTVTGGTPRGAARRYYRLALVP